MLELACAYAIRRDPGRLPRLVTIVAVSKALMGLGMMGPGRHVRLGYVWSLGNVTDGLAEILLCAIVIAIVRRWMRPDRPAVSLVTGYLILTAFGKIDIACFKCFV